VSWVASQVALVMPLGPGAEFWFPLASASLTSRSVTSRRMSSREVLFKLGVSIIARDVAIPWGGAGDFRSYNLIRNSPKELVFHQPIRAS